MQYIYTDFYAHTYTRICVCTQGHIPLVHVPLYRKYFFNILKSHKSIENTIRKYTLTELRSLSEVRGICRRRALDVKVC